MKIDFHSHAKLAKYLPFSENYTDWLFDYALKSGLDALCVTEHFNTSEFAKVYNYIYVNSKVQNDVLIYKNGLKIFAGMETDVKEGGHILCIGRIKDILELNDRLKDHKDPENFLPFHDLMTLFADYDLLIGNAHPFRSGGHVPTCALEDLEKLFFIDLNGKDIAADQKKCQKLTYDYAKRLNKPVVAGSDTHQALQYACVYNDLKVDVDTLAGLKEALLKKAYQIVIDDNVCFKVEAAALLKKCLKQIDALGGDYVQMLVDRDKEM